MIDFEKIGKYQITAKLGQGSFGVVYKGRDAYLKRDVAIKVCSVEDEGLRKRFFREAEIAGKLVHKNIVTVYEFGFEGKIPFLVQEILSGEDLSRIVKRRAPLAPIIKLDYLLQVANGLGYAHSEGVIHRDIKPGNIRVLENDRVKIMDFGIAKLASAETQLTQKGVTMGTASYLPPEQVRGSDLDHRADIFSFGVLAYELLTYERPFRGNTLSALVYQILYKVPQSMIEVWPESPEPLSLLIARCLEKKPDRRFGSFAELVPELEALRADVAAGKWPVLEAAPTNAVRVPTEVIEVGRSREPSDVLSPTAISQTAKGVLEGKVGEYTISTAASARDVLRPQETRRSGRSTRPLPAQPIEALPASAQPAATENSSAAQPARAGGARGSVPVRDSSPARVPDADLSTAEVPASRATATGPAADDAGLATRVMAATPVPTFETGSDLTLTAQEIGELVAKGQLEEAKEQLEATISRQDATGIPTPDQPPPAAASPPDQPSAAATQSLPGGEATAPQAAPETAPRSASQRPPAPTAPPRGPAAAPKTSSLGEASAVASSDTYRTVIGPPLARFKWVGLAAGSLLATGLVWLLLRGDGQASDPVVETTPEPPPAVATAAPAQPALGAVTVNASPWAEITEITDAKGYVQDLPAFPQTPIYLELPPGAYKIHLEQPQGEEIRTCDVVVKLETVVECAAEFAEPSVTEYFKESGWW